MQVRYVIYEDGDVLEHPNIFSVAPAGTALTLRDVRAAFPVPGRYHFRAMKSWKNTYGASSPPLVLVSLRLYTVAIAALSPPRGVGLQHAPTHDHQSCAPSLSFARAHHSRPSVHTHPVPPSTQIVWLDLHSDDDVVAPCAGKIVLKVSRLEGTGASSGGSADAALGASAPQVQRTQSAPVASPAGGGLDSFFSGGGSGSASPLPTARASSASSSSASDLLGELMGAPPAAAPVAPSAGDPFGLFA